MQKFLSRPEAIRLAAELTNPKLSEQHHPYDWQMCLECYCVAYNWGRCGYFFGAVLDRKIKDYIKSLISATPGNFSSGDQFAKVADSLMHNAHNLGNSQWIAYGVKP